MVFDYEKGSDLLVRVNGTVLGGVTALCRTMRQSQKEIYEYLTDKPVAVIPEKMYYIQIKLNRSAEYPFDGDISCVEIAGGGRIERYTSCFVHREKSDVLPRGETEYTVTIEARERSVLYE